MGVPGNLRDVEGIVLAEGFPDRAALASEQDRKLRRMLSAILPGNAFYARKFAESGLAADQEHGLADLRRLCFTTKAELANDQNAHPPYGSRLTYEIERYVRLHQTSGTTGEPLRCLDTADDWVWWMTCWETIYAAAGVTRADRLFIPASFGPFIGFWGAFEGAVHRGMLAMAGGAMTSTARLGFMRDNEVTVVLTTPTYALRLAEVAGVESIDLPGMPVRALIVAGEPGGSIPATRERLERSWGAEVFDHTGMTEIGPAGFECQAHPGGVHLNEHEWIVEVIEPDGERLLEPGEEGELVLTNLGRWGSPLLRYRTGDRVRLTDERCPCGRWLMRMIGGILGRADDMVHVKGNNVYPSSIEAVVRGFAEVIEYRAEVVERPTGNALIIDVEPTPGSGASGESLGRRVKIAIRNRLHFSAEVRVVEPGSLPRFEGKGKRFTLRRESAGSEGGTPG